MGMQCSFLSLLGDLKRHLLRASPVWGHRVVVAPQTIHHTRTRMPVEGGDVLHRDDERLFRMAREGEKV